jgi:DNA-binding CsgD family transcriptional regulator
MVLFLEQFWNSLGTDIRQNPLMNYSLTPLQYLGVPTVTVDQFGRLTSCNRHATSLLQVEEDAVIGLEWHTVIRVERTKTCCPLCETRHALRRGQEPRPVTARLRTSSGNRKVVLVPIPSATDISADIGFLILDANAPDLDAPATAGPSWIPGPVARGHDDRLITELTARERDILRCVVEGRDARSISRELGISHATARNYVQRTLNKLGVRNKAEAVTVALTRNLLAV